MKHLALVFSILWLLSWLGGGIVLLFSEAHWAIAVGCMLMSSWWLVYDLVKRKRG